MTTEILIERGLRETRAAIVENGALQEVHIERVSRRGLVGNVYKGRVTRVLPGMQAAFIDIGEEKNAFLYVDDALLPPNLEDTDSDLPTGHTRRKKTITELVKQGQEVIVQVVMKEFGDELGHGPPTAAVGHVHRSMLDIEALGEWAWLGGHRHGLLGGWARMVVRFIRVWRADSVGRPGIRTSPRSPRRGGAGALAGSDRPRKPGGRG